MTTHTCHCGATQGVRWYIPGARCPAHTPAAITGTPEPGHAHAKPHAATQPPALAPTPPRPVTWPPRHTGPCAQCHNPTHRYGPGGAPLCPTCRPTTTRTTTP